MSKHRIYPLIAGIGFIACTACVGPFRSGSKADPCVAVRSNPTRPFDSSSTAALAGRYRLILVSDWDDEAGRFATGKLTLLPTDTLHQFYEQLFTGRWRRSGNRVLWGWAELDTNDVSIPWSSDPAARDPEHPGVLLHSNGALELGVWRGLDGSSTTLSVRDVSSSGFSGTWDSDLGIGVVVKDGRQLPNPYGHFCAERTS